MSIPEYINIPSSAIPISHPTASNSKAKEPGETAIRPPNKPIRSPSFPPSTATQQSQTQQSRKFGVPSATSISSNVSDMLLSSLLPPNLPKIPGGSKDQGPGIPRELTTRKEALSVPLISNNFRRFVTKVGPCFWLQDRVEEILFWRKPRWTWAWIMLWTMISFKPRLLLLAPTVSLLLILLNIQERTSPTKSLLGIPLQPSDDIGTSRLFSKSDEADPSASKINSTISGNGYSATNATEGETNPAVPPKEAESGVDYYMNIQAIQNLMGVVSDIYDYVTPRLSRLTSPANTSPTAFPITQTHLLLILLVPSAGLPLLPSAFIPYLLLPLGIAPPLFFHPNLTALILSLPRNRDLLRLRAKLEDAALTDGLDDEIGRRPIGKVEVWENERLDPAIVAKPPPSGILPQGAWSTKHLRAGERNPWIKIMQPGSLWLDEQPVEASAEKGEAEEGKEGDKQEKMILALQDGWEFIPKEEWRVDVSGLWSDVGSDADGWVYSDDSWQNPSFAPLTIEADSRTGDKGTMPDLGLRKITRRRRWWRRVYERSDGSERISQPA